MSINDADRAVHFIKKGTRVFFFSHAIYLNSSLDFSVATGSVLY